MDTKVYVLGCENFKHLFQEFGFRFEKHWGGKYYPLISNTPLDKWSDGVLYYLHKIADEYIILLSEDFYMVKDTDLKAVERLVKIAKEKKADRVSLMGNHSPHRTVNVGEDLWKYLPNMPYQLSFEASIYRTSFLTEHMRMGENPWQSETNRNAEQLNGNVYCSTKPVIWYGDKIRRGMIQEEVICPYL